MEKLFTVTAQLRLIIRAEHPGEAIDTVVDAVTDLPGEEIVMVVVDRGNFRAQLGDMTEQERAAVERWLETKRLAARTLGES